MKGEFSENTKRTLAKRAGEKCSLCEKSTSKPHSTNKTAFINLGEAAHIQGHKDGKHTRFNNSMSDSEKSDIDNAIWLCTGCHKEVDSDSCKYTVEFLIETKRVHENKIALGDFDITWKEFDLYKQRILDLEKLIAEKEKSKSLQEILYNKEINDLRIDLEKLKNEKEEFEKAIDQLKNTIAIFDYNNISDNTLQLIKAFKEGNLAFVKEVLNENSLEYQENELARRRLLKAQINEIESDFISAELNYEKAYKICNSYEFISKYSSFLIRKGKIDLAIDICNNVLIKEENLNIKITLYLLIAKAYLKGIQSRNAISCLHGALKFMENFTDSHNYDYVHAKIYRLLGGAFMNLGELRNALENFQLSINYYIKLKIEKNIFHKAEWAVLFSDIGRLYIKNNNASEVLLFLKNAQSAYESLEDKDILALVQTYVNIVDACLNRKVFNLDEARNYLELAKSTITTEFSSQPLKFLETYISVFCGSADSYFITGQFPMARKDYKQAIRIAEHFLSEHNVLHINILSTVYGNYAVFLNHNKRISEANKFIDKAIHIMSNVIEDDHETNFHLAKLFSLKFEISKNQTRDIDFLIKANYFIEKCSDLTVAKFWKSKINKALEATTNS